MSLTQERLKKLLHYDPETGIFTRLVNVANVKAGDEAGCRKGNYIRISIDGRSYRAHILAWLYMTGNWPERFLDHADTNKQKNVWTNLREATKSQNLANIGIIKSNTSGFKGVSRYKQGEARGKPWQAGIVKEGRRKHLGHFETKEEAHAAYCAAAEKLFGEFARAA